MPQCRAANIDSSARQAEHDNNVREIATVPSRAVGLAVASSTRQRASCAKATPIAALRFCAFLRVFMHVLGPQGHVVRSSPSPARHPAAVQIHDGGQAAPILIGLDVG